MLAAGGVPLAFFDARTSRLPNVVTLPAYPVSLVLLGTAAPFLADGAGRFVHALIGMAVAVASNIVQCMELLQSKPDGFTVLSGDDNLVLAQMAIGMEGIISVAANCFPKEMSDLINLAIVGKFDKARKVHYKLLTGIDLLFADGNPPGVKYVLSQQGVCNNILRLPVTTVSEATAKKLNAFLKTL